MTKNSQKLLTVNTTNIDIAVSKTHFITCVNKQVLLVSVSLNNLSISHLQRLSESFLKKHNFIDIVTRDLLRFLSVRNL